jgi:hypothetical protein
LIKASGLGGNPNEFLRHLKQLFNHYLWMSHFPKPRKDVKFITFPKSGKDPKFLQSLRPIGLLSTAVKLLEKVILKIVQRLIEERSVVFSESCRVVSALLRLGASSGT